MDTMIKCYYQIAIDSGGELYLDAEQQLIAQGEAVVPFLQEKIKDALPFPKLITQVILERIVDNQSFQACFDYFEKAEQRAAQTPMGTPPPEGVANYLVQNLGDSVASLLGVYLVKLDQVWPFWKILGTILYLGQLDSAASADTLIWFLSTTANEHYRKLAVQSLVAVGNASVLNKIETELKSLEAVRDALQQAAEQIRGSLKPQT